VATTYHLPKKRGALKVPKSLFWEHPGFVVSHNTKLQQPCIYAWLL